MKLVNSIRKRLDRLFMVRFDRATGFYRHKRFGRYVYIRYPRHLAKTSDILWVCEKLFFHYYMPVAGDVVVDLGAGYGDEALYLASKVNGIRYIGVEAQPVIFECLANTMHYLDDNYVASPYAISSEPVRFVSHYSYAAVGGTEAGYIEVPTISWQDFLRRYRIDRIDLFKMNIEGAEKSIVEGISDFSFIKRFIISCHDFRANNGDGEYLRTKSAVVACLEKNGYDIRPFNYGISFADDWIYAEHRNPGTNNL
jgi:FkbM family methyltransferase